MDDRGAVAAWPGVGPSASFSGAGWILDEGVAIEAGPFSDPSFVTDDELVALAFPDLDSVAEARALFASDPIVIECPSTSTGGAARR